MSVTCSACGQEWARDPALEVACPLCAAPIGAHCRRPSGHSGPMVPLHRERDELAMQTVPGYGHCPKGPAKQGRLL